MPDAYAGLVATVDRLLARFGKDCALVHVTPGGYNPATGTVEPGGEVSYAARAIESGYTLENLGDTLIEAGNKAGVFKIIDPAFDGNVAVSMQLRLAGDKLRNLREVQPVAPGPHCLYWRFVAGS